VAASATVYVLSHFGGSITTPAGPGLSPGLAQQAIPFMSNGRI
jgi:hypothetical protein